MKPGIELRNKRVLVVGLARTGVATALFCAARGARVTATEQRTAAQLGEIVMPLRDAGCVFEFGGHVPATFLDQDLIVPSPGVPATLPGLEAARAAQIPVWSEIELAWRFLHGKLIAITGSNGKTTVTSLVAHILTGAGMPVIVAGNIGTPLISRVAETNAASITVAEVSSFQLELIAAFRPEIGVLLNVTPDHLDRHSSFEEYRRAKARLFENQTNADLAVLNADDAAVRGHAPARPRLYWFSRSRRVAAGAWMRGEQIVFRRHSAETADTGGPFDSDEPGEPGEPGDTGGTGETVLLARSEIHLRGEHNVENVLAAATTAFLAGASATAIAAGVKSFPGMEHRLEFVAEIAGVSFFNDSKATNVDATLKALEAFSGGLFVILGGKDKGIDYGPLGEPLRQRAKRVLLIGAAADKIAAQLKEQWAKPQGAAALGAAGAPIKRGTREVPMEHAGTLERAVMLAFEHARPGDTVLLAPACASFDQFDNYEHRGRVFKESIHAIAAAAVASAGPEKG